MGDQFSEWVKNNYDPKNPDFYINSFMHELKERKNRKVKGHFDIEEYETQEERIVDLKRICGKYKIPTSMFD
jgi:hypothetical protein